MKTFKLKRTFLPLTLLLSAPAFAGQNGTMMQYFHWYVPNDGALWTQVESNAPALAENGFTALWLPPAALLRNSDRKPSRPKLNNY